MKKLVELRTYRTDGFMAHPTIYKWPWNLMDPLREEHNFSYHTQHGIDPHIGGRQAKTIAIDGSSWFTGVHPELAGICNLL